MKLRKIAWLLLIPSLAWATTPISKTIDSIKATGGNALTVPSGPSGGSLLAGTWTQEVLSPQCNGSTTSYTLANTPTAGSVVALFADSQILRQGSGLDYTISGATITLTTACANGQILYAYYTH